VLIEHRVDDVDEGLVAREETVTPGKQIALEPSLTHVFAKHFHHASIDGEVFVHGQKRFHENFVGGFVDGVEAVRGGLIRAEDAEILGIGVLLHDVAQESSEDPGGFANFPARLGHAYGVLAEVGHGQLLQEQTAIGVGIRAHPAVAAGSELREFGKQFAAGVE